MSRTPEGKVKDKVTALLRTHGAWHCFPVTGGFGTQGVPDILVCHRGDFLGVECKASHSKPPTKLQELQLMQIAEAGGAAMVIHASNLSELESWLTRSIRRPHGLPLCGLEGDNQNE